MAELGKQGKDVLGWGMSSELPLVTVITPAYNVGPYIGEAIESVLAQSFTNFEYIVVDDGSTDETVAEIQRRMATDDRVRLIEADHQGGPHARNLGIKEARGKYIAFLDGDDRWSVEFLAKQLETLESLDSDVAAVFCRARVMSESGRVYLFRWQRAGKYNFDQMLVGSCPPRVGSSLLIKKSAFDQAGLFDVTVISAQDLDMWLRIQRDSDMPYFYGTPNYLLDIRIRPGAISRDSTRRFVALERLINDYGPDMKKMPMGMAYVRAAVFAYRADHDDDYANRWAAEARKAGILRLLRDSYGRKVLLWSSMSPRARGLVRKGTDLGRSSLSKGLAVVSAVGR